MQAHLKLFGKNIKRTQVQKRMSVETEVKAVEQTVEATIEKVETKAVEEVKAVEADLTKGVTAVKADVKNLSIKLTAEEKLALRDMEVVFLKAQQQYAQLENQMKEIRNNFQAKVDEFTKKYLIDKATYVFDGVALEFRRITQDIKKEL